MSDPVAGEDCALTVRQAKVLSVIEEFKYPPSLREVAKKMEITVSGIVRHIAVLEQKGFIERAHSGSRGIRVVPAWWAHTRLIAAMAEWLCAVTPTVSREYLIDLFVRPKSHAQVWRNFCEACPSRVEELAKQIRWRRNAQ